MSHYSVLLNESIELLNINPDGVYIDGTFGRGGHSKLILSKLNANGCLIAFDKDIEAVNYAKSTINDGRFKIVHGSFTLAKDFLQQIGMSEIDGAIFDFGVSSPQIDNPRRGFSVRFDGPLDMRMDNTKGISAAQWIESVSEEELSDVLWRYGEEKSSRRIAKAIIQQRKNRPIMTTFELAEIIKNAVPDKPQSQHPAIRSFQAIRIKINNELEDIEVLLNTLPHMLKPHGRMVVISFHSLEDRLVKNKFRKLSTDEQLPKWVYKKPKVAEFRLVAKKVRASAIELIENNRSRSAIMRAIERIGTINA